MENLGITRSSMQGFSVLRPGERLGLALNVPRPHELFRSLPSEDLFLMVLDADPEDVDLAIQYANEEQHRDIIDFYVWKKDEICPELVMAWLQRLLECDEGKLVKVLGNLDPELLIYTLKFYIDVLVQDDPDDEIPDYENAESAPKSVDNVFYYVHLKKDFIDTIDSIILHLFNFSYQAYWGLLEGCRHELSLELMENAFRWRSSRMEEKGFLNYIDSQAIFTLLQDDEIEEIKRFPSKRARISDIPDNGEFVSHSYFCGMSDDSFLSKIVDNLKGKAEIRELKWEIILTMNKLISASLPIMNDIKNIRDCVKKGMDTLNLSLDYLAGGKVEVAIEFVMEVPIETIFQVGHSLVANLGKRLSSFLQNSHILHSETLFLLGSSEMEILQGAMKLPPVFFDSNVEAYASFETKEQVDRVLKTMKEAECLDRLFHEHFKFQMMEIEKFDANELYQDELTFSNLFISGICNIILNRKFEFVPIPAARLKEISQKAFQNMGGKIKFHSKYAEEFLRWKAELTSQWSEKNRNILDELLGSWIKEFTEEFGPHYFSSKIDPRFIKTILVKAE